MAIAPFRTGTYAKYVDVERGVINRRIFADQDIYQAELERIFARCWLYLAHESQIPEPNDYVLVNMAQESVIVTRGRDGKIRALLNSCRHRGNKVCRADAGKANAFTCPYHGWSYDNTGRLIGLPGSKEYYHDRLDQSQWGLAEVAQVDSYNGLIFGTFDPEAPSLGEYLGDMRWGLDILLGQGDLVAVPGLARWTMDVNWKFASDNAVGDMYHAFFTHRSATLAGHGGPSGSVPGGGALTPRQEPGFTLVAAYGHGLNASYIKEGQFDFDSPLTAWRKNPETLQKLGPRRAKVKRSNMNVFPNLFVNSGSRELMLRNPLGPSKIEIWKTVLVDRNAAPEVRRAQIRGSNRHFGPAGMYEQDDGENWDQSTAAAQGLIAQRYDLNYAMAVGEGVVERGDDPPVIESLTNEHAQRWMYRCWAEFMDAESWPELRAHHSIPEGRL